MAGCFTTPGRGWVRLSDEHTFKPDLASIETFHRAVAQIKAMTVQGCIVATGMIQMRDDYTPTYKMPDGKMRGVGFGHMNAQPAQLVLKSGQAVALQPYKAEQECVCCK
jgi:hypothetical protein